jgi:hypothetical protein
MSLVDELTRLARERFSSSVGELLQTASNRVPRSFGELESYQPRRSRLGAKLDAAARLREGAEKRFARGVESLAREARGVIGKPPLWLRMAGKARGDVGRWARERMVEWGEKTGRQTFLDQYFHKDSMAPGRYTRFSAEVGESGWARQATPATMALRSMDAKDPFMMHALTLKLQKLMAYEAGVLAEHEFRSTMSPAWGDFDGRKVVGSPAFDPVLGREVRGVQSEIKEVSEFLNDRLRLKLEPQDLQNTATVVERAQAASQDWIEKLRRTRDLEKAIDPAMRELDRRQKDILAERKDYPERLKREGQLGNGLQRGKPRMGKRRVGDASVEAVMDQWRAIQGVGRALS